MRESRGKKMGGSFLNERREERRLGEGQQLMTLNREGIGWATGGDISK